MSLFLQPYHLHICHIKGRDNRVADTLCRQSLSVVCPALMSSTLCGDCLGLGFLCLVDYADLTLGFRIHTLKLNSNYSNSNYGT